jgi:hypothetical protein
VPILPIIDLLILMGWSSLMFGAFLKAIDITTRYRPAPLGLTSIDFAVIAAMCFGFALTLAARTWVKLHEPSLLDLRRRQLQKSARRRVHPLEDGDEEPPEDEAVVVRAASADRP